MRCRASTSRREVASTSRSRSIDEATSASVIVRSRAAAISSARGRPSRRATTCRPGRRRVGPVRCCRRPWHRLPRRAGGTVGSPERPSRQSASGPSEMTCSPSMASGFAARRQDPQVIAVGEHRRHDGHNCVDDVLAVVEHDEGVDRAETDERSELPPGRRSQVERGGDGRGHAGGVGDSRQLDEDRAPRVPRRRGSRRRRRPGGSCPHRPGRRP